MIYDFSEFPTVFESKGKKYPIHTDFREWIRFESLLTNSDVPENLKTVIALRMIFADNVPEDILPAAKFIFWFYRGGRERRIMKNNDGSAVLESRRVYDFEYDSEYVFAAFLGQYGINLAHTDYMHWWEFRALFRGLRECRMTDIMGYRGAEISDDLPESRREFLLDMQELYELPVSLTEKRKIEAARKFLNG